MKKDKKGGKDCGCTHKNDSLTPQEYIQACDLGIQDRSRAYIRARLDAGKGTGKKCGASHIPAKATCTKGAGGKSGSKKELRLKNIQGNNKKLAEFWKTPGSTKGVGNKVKRGAEFAANAGALANFARAGVQAGYGNYGKAAQSLLTAGSLTNMAAGSRAQRQGNIALAKDFNRRASTFGTVNSGISVARGLISGQTQYNMKQKFSRAREMGERMGRRWTSTTVSSKPGWTEKLNKKRDGGSWAKGFSSMDAETALTANAMNLATDKYKGEKRKRNAQGQPQNMIYANTFNT